MTAMTFSGTTRVLLGLAAAACLAGPAAAAPPAAFGRYVIHTLPAGGTPMEVRSRGYRAVPRDVTVGPGDETAAADFRLVPLPLNLSAVEVRAAVPHGHVARYGAIPQVAD